jgi:hypothetical protein
MKRLLSSAVPAAATLLTLPPELSAQQPLPKASAGEVSTMTAKVLAVDAAARPVVVA